MSSISRFRSRAQRLLGIAGLIAGVGVTQQTADFVPILELEKPVYVANESLRFWIGVTARSTIPDYLTSTCILHTIRPDGTNSDEHVSWPIDGDASRGWKGGWGLGKQAAIGRYLVSFEFAGLRTPSQAIEIVPDPLAGRIDARWVFADSKSGGGIHARSVVLHVENNTGRTLRFAKPGLLDSDVWLKVRTFQPRSEESTFVPQFALLRKDEIPSYSFDKLDWDNQTRWPMITVPAGGSVDRPLMLASAYSFRDSQDYEFTIETVLTIFVGEPGDPDARLFPMRIPVSAMTRFRW